MDMYEQLVDTYLTIVEHLAVIPQFPVLFDDKGEPCFHESPVKVAWAAFPDFLAVDLRNHQAQMVEVTKSEYPEALNLVERVMERREDIERYVRWFTSDEFQIQWRFFVRRKKLDDFKSKLEAAGIQAKLTALEDVFDKLRDVMP